MSVWQLQDAKNRFSEVVDDAVRKGPQVITRRGIETAVVLSAEDYRKLVVGQARLGDFFLNSPLVDSGIDLERDKSYPRPDLDL